MSHMIIGWKEWIALPDLGIPALQVKIDTGAKTSSLHAENIHFLMLKHIPYLEFDIFPFKKNSPHIRSHAPIKDKRTVKSSCGEKEFRPVITTTIKLGELSWEIELNLTNRDYMGSRMILGREALQEGIIIDASKKYLHGKLSENQARKLYDSQMF